MPVQAKAEIYHNPTKYAGHEATTEHDASRAFLKSVSHGKTLKIKPQSSQRARSFKLFLAFLAHFAVKKR
jgi:hypothetical protein